MENDTKRYTRTTESSGSSRYNQEEWKRRGSRYPDKAQADNKKAGKKQKSADRRTPVRQRKIKAKAPYPSKASDLMPASPETDETINSENIGIITEEAGNTGGAGVRTGEIQWEKSAEEARMEKADAVYGEKTPDEAAAEGEAAVSSGEAAEAGTGGDPAAGSAEDLPGEAEKTDAETAGRAKADTDSEAVGSAKANADAIADGNAQVDADARADGNAQADADAIADGNAQADADAQAAGNIQDDSDEQAAGNIQDDSDEQAVGNAETDAEPGGGAQTDSESAVAEDGETGENGGAGQDGPSEAASEEETAGMDPGKAAADPGKQSSSPSVWSRLAAGFARHDPAMIGLALVAAALLTAYIVVGVYFGSHFYPNTEVYGIDWSRKTVEEVRSDVADQISRYSLTIQERGGAVETIEAGQIGLEYEDKNGIEKALESQNSFIWPVMMLLKKTASASIETTYRRDEMDTVLSELSCLQKENMQRPKNAYIGMNAEGTKLEVIPEEEGTTLDYETTKESILKALDRGETTVDLEQASCYVRPRVFSDDERLNTETEEKNRLLGAKITYDFGDRQEVVDAEVIETFLTEDENGNYMIDPDRVWQYVADLAARYDTYEGYRTFHTSTGETVELYGGDYGWLTDQETTAQELLQMLQDQTVTTTQPEYICTAMSRSENDIGDTYVEVCISRQEMWCYQNGYLIIDTPVVTGTPGTGHGTPSGGVWSIDGKYPDYVLVGPDYRCPVQYWMPFNGDVGIHDLSSRYYFGGDIYLYNGSHGCVNTPLDAVAQIFDIVSTGTAVVVYE